MHPKLRASGWSTFMFAPRDLVRLFLYKHSRAKSANGHQSNQLLFALEKFEVYMSCQITLQFSDSSYAEGSTLLTCILFKNLSDLKFLF